MIGLLLIASVGVGVSVVDGVDEPTADAIVDAVAEAVRTSTTSAVKRCEGCAEPAVVLQLFGGPTLVRVVARSVGRSDEPLTVDVDRNQIEPAAFDALAKAFFPPAPPALSKPPPPPSVAIVAPPEPSTSVAPFVLLGTAFAAGTAAAILGARSRSAKNQLEAGLLDNAELNQLLDQQRNEGLAANVLIGASVTLAVSAVVWWVLD
ncbi:MAG: hypothetical protein RMA76_03505 [Deltaproteobacteria bacterium]